MFLGIIYEEMYFSTDFARLALGEPDGSLAIDWELQVRMRAFFLEANSSHVLPF